MPESDIRVNLKDLQAFDEATKWKFFSLRIQRIDCQHIMHFKEKMILQ